MSKDLYQLAAPARATMLKELERISVDRPLEANELALQQLGIDLSCIIGAFVMSNGRGRRETTMIVHGALGHVLAGVAANLQVYLPNTAPTPDNSWVVTMGEITRHSREIFERSVAGGADSAVTMVADADGTLRPKPFDVTEMLKGRAP